MKNASIVPAPPFESLALDPNERFILQDYQFQVVNAIDPAGRRTAIHLPYGSGKAPIALFKVMQQAYATGGNVAVILVKAHLRHTWMRNIRRVWRQRTMNGWWLSSVLKDEDFVVYYDKAATVLDEKMRGVTVDPKFARRMHFLVMSYAQVATYQQVLSRIVSSPGCCALIGDESTAMKNVATKTSKACLAVSSACSPRVLRMTLTGNPTPEGPQEIWAQFQFLYPNGNPFGATYYKFLQNWFLKHDYGYALKYERRIEFSDVIARHSISLSASAFDEFRKMARSAERYVMELWEPSGTQIRLLNELYESWSMMYDPEASVESTDERDEREPVEFSHTMSVMQKAQQICSGFYYFDDGDPVILSENPKLARLRDLIEVLLEENRSRKIIIWSAYKAERPTMLATLNNSGIKTVLGPDTAALTEFALPTGASCIIMPASLAEGYNELVVADVMIFYSQSYSNEKRAQAEARINRIGQSSPVVTYIDLAAQGMPDMAVSTLMQGKNLTAARVAGVISQYLKAGMK